MKQIYFKCTVVLLLLIFNACHKQTKKAAIIRPSSITHSFHGIEFVEVPPGPFTSGYNNQTLFINYTYYIMKYEVTCAQYFRFLQTQLAQKKVWIENGLVMKKLSGYTHVSDTTRFIKKLDAAIYQQGDTLALNPYFAHHPVTQVNYYGCTEFCRQYDFRLPSRLEWEKAARGNTGRLFPWGNKIDGSNANYYNSQDPYEPGTTPVGFYNGQTHNGFKTTNSPSPYGCYDMAGNAYEYVSDYFCKVTGGGGGYHYHTAGMLAAPFQNCFGLPAPIESGVCDTADGFRAIYIPIL